MDFSDCFTPKKKEEDEEEKGTSRTNEIARQNLTFDFASPKFGTDAAVFGGEDDTGAAAPFGEDEEDAPDWNKDVREISKEWSTPMQKKNMDFEAFSELEEMDQQRFSGKQLKPLVKKFLSESFESKKSPSKKMVRNVVANLILSAEGDAKALWNILHDEEQRISLLNQIAKEVESTAEDGGEEIDSKDDAKKADIDLTSTPADEAKGDLCSEVKKAANNSFAFAGDSSFTFNAGDSSFASFAATGESEGNTKEAATSDKTDFSFAPASFGSTGGATTNMFGVDPSVSTSSTSVVASNGDTFGASDGGNVFSSTFTTGGSDPFGTTTPFSTVETTKNVATDDTTATESATLSDVFRTELNALYTHIDDKKLLGKVDGIVKKYESNAEKLFRKVQKKYGTRDDTCVVIIARMEQALQRFSSNKSAGEAADNGSVSFDASVSSSFASSFDTGSKTDSGNGSTWSFAATAENSADGFASGGFGSSEFGSGGFGSSDAANPFTAFTSESASTKDDEEKTRTGSEDTPASETFSIEDGKRGYFEEADAKAAVARAGASMKAACGRVHLSTKSIKESAALVLADFFRGLRRVTVADLADIISGIHEDEALRSLTHISQSLSHLDIAEVNLSDNALGRKGIVACKSLLSSRPALRKLWLENNGLSAEACREVADLLLGSEGPSARLPLHTLHFYNNMSGDGGGENVARIVACSPELQDFRLGSTRCLEKGGEAIGRALCACRKLRKLNVADNTFKVKGGKAIANAVKSMPDLRTLYLGDNSFDVEVVRALCRSLLESKSDSASLTLEELDLSFSETLAEGSSDVAKLLFACPKLRILNLEGNETEDEGALEIGSAVATTCADIEVLNLAANYITGPVALKIVESLKDKKQLRLVDLRENNISSKYAKSIRRVLPSSCEVNLEDQEDDDEDNTGDEGEEKTVNHDTGAKPTWDPEQLKAMMPASDTWKCEACLVPNPPDRVKCRSCGADRPGYNKVCEKESSSGPTFDFDMSTSTGASITFGATNAAAGSEGLNFNFDLSSGDAAKDSSAFSLGAADAESKDDADAPCLLIDTDGGVDDAVALLMALASTKIDSITTVFGNTSASQAAKNVERLQWARVQSSKERVSQQRSVPVVVGSETALVGFGSPPPSWPGHGPDGLGKANLVDPPSSFLNRAQKGVHAAAHIIERCRALKGQLTIVMLGPLTNLALALKLEPSLPNLVSSVVVMGGTMRGQGNTTAVAEFNTYCDPEAQHVVFEAFDADKLVMVPWELALDNSYRWADLDVLAKRASMGSTMKQLFGAYEDLVRGKTGVEKADAGKEEFCPADAYAMAVALHPKRAVVESKELRAFVELQGRCRGMTAYDCGGSMDKSKCPTRPNATLVTKIDKGFCWKLVKLAAGWDE